jgi:hypothetical protein
LLGGQEPVLSFLGKLTGFTKAERLFPKSGMFSAQARAENEVKKGKDDRQSDVVSTKEFK